MGTSASLRVLSSTKDVVQYASYDCFINTVVAAIGATLACSGAPALNNALDCAQVIDAEEFEDSSAMFLRQAINAYLQACQDNSRQPWGVEDALKDNHPSFSAHGIIGLMGPSISDEDGMVASKEACEFVLDLANNVLIVHGASSTCTIDLERFEGKDPDALYQQLSQAPLAWDNLAAAQTTIEALLDQIPDATPYVFPTADALTTLPSHQLPPPLPDSGPGSHEGLKAQMEFHPEEGYWPRFVGSVLRSYSAALARPNTLWVDPGSDSIRLLIDCSSGFASAAEARAVLSLIENSSEVLEKVAGARITLEQGKSRTIQSARMVSVSVGELDTEDESIEDPTPNSLVVRAHQERLAALPSMSQDQLVIEKLMALGSMDAPLLAALEHVDISNDPQLGWSSALCDVVWELDQALDNDNPRWLARWQQLSPAQQEQLLDNMDPAVQFKIFSQLQNVSSSIQRRPSL